MTKVWVYYNQNKKAYLISGVDQGPKFLVNGTIFTIAWAQVVLDEHEFLTIRNGELNKELI